MVWPYVRFTLSYRDVKDLLAERGWTSRMRPFGDGSSPLFARNLRAEDCHDKSNGMAENPGSSSSTSGGNGSAPCLQRLISVVAESSVGYEMTLDGEDVGRESAELIQ